MKDYKTFYTRISQPFRGKEKVVLYANKALTGFMYMAYPLFLSFSYLYQKQYTNTDHLKMILIPLASFIVVSLFRKKVNRKRPYETYDLNPIIHKETKGQSFPSRHVFSSAIISMCFLYYVPVLGIIGLVMTIIACAVRVVGGVHYISDVAAGLLIGVLAGMLFYL